MSEPRLVPGAENAGERRLSRARLRWPVSIGIALLCTLLAVRYASSSYVYVLEASVLDVLLATRPVRSPDPHLAIVAIERERIDRYDQERPPDCTCGAIPRSQLGELISRLKRGGAGVIVLDLALNAACPAKDAQGVPHDARLVAALQQPGETILAARAATNPDKLFFRYPPAKFVGKPGHQRIIASPVLYNPQGVIRGVSMIQTGMPTDLERAQVSPLELAGRVLPPICAAAYNAWVGRPRQVPEAEGEHAVDCSGLTVPTWAGSRIYLMPPAARQAASNNHVMLINWCGPAGTVPTYAFGAVMQATRQQVRDWFSDHIVLIGSAAERLNTPIRGAPRKVRPPFLDQSGERSLTGVEVHAQALNTLLQRRFLRPVSRPIMWGLLLVCTLLASLAFQRLTTWPAVLTATAIAVALMLAAWILVRWDYWLFVALPIGATATSSTMTAIWGYARSRQEAATLSREAAARDAATDVLVHDLKQPLMVISGVASYIRLLQQRGQPLDSPELLERIEKQVDRALGDLEELLNISPGRSMTLKCESFDLAALTADLALAQSTKSRSHQVVVQPEQGVWVFADPRCMGRAVNNLIDNAIKYWPGGGTVRVEIESRARDVVLRVIDHGIGIGHDKQATVFNRFERAVPDGMHIHGSGIGLYSVKRVVEAHGGSVSLHSEPGKGSTFTLSLPHRVEAQSQERSASV